MLAAARFPLGRLLFGAFLALVGLSAPPAQAAGAKLRLVKRLWGTGEVRLVEGGRERPLERYREPISVVATEISPDGRWAFVWHSPARPPLQLAIYDLRTMRRTARFAPGFGGEMHFTPGGNLVHRWGCGTNCAQLAVYDVHGKTLLSTGGSGVEVSPTQRFAVTGPSLFAAEEPAVIYDLDAGRSVYKRDRPRGDSFLLNDVRWDDKRCVISLELAHLHDSKAQHVVVRPPRQPTLGPARSRGFR